MTDLTRLLGAFWTQPPYEPYQKRPLSEAALSAFEGQHRVRLPTTMVTLLRAQNGGYTDWTFRFATDSPNVVHRMLRGIGQGFPALEQQAWWQTPEGEQDWRPRDPLLLIPFDGDGHWDLCLDYRGSAADRDGHAIDPGVTVIDGELEQEEAVSPSFDGYLARLVHCSQADRP